MLDLDVEESREYMLVIHYANDERDEGHPYNVDVVSRPIGIVVNDG